MEKQLTTRDKLINEIVADRIESGTDSIQCIMACQIGDRSKKVDTIQ